MKQTIDISIRNRLDRQIGILDDFFNDQIEYFLDGKVMAFNFSVLDEKDYRSLLANGNYLSFVFEDEDYHFQIVKRDEDEDIITVTAWSLAMELNNETKKAYTGTSMTFIQYLNVFDGEKILIVNINEIPDKKISHTFDSQTTMLERLFSLATAFEAEIEFITELAEDGSLSRLIINIYKAHSESTQGMGQNKTAQVFRFGDEIETVQKISEIMEIYSAIRPVGKDGLTLSGYTAEDVLNEDGNVLYYLKNGMIYAPQTREQFQSNLINKTDGWTVYDWETEYSTQATLFGNSVSKMRVISVPKTTWTIDGAINAKIGDTISIEDDGYTPPIYLEARITGQKRSISNPDNIETTLSNVEDKQSEIDPALLAMMNSLVNKKVVYTSNLITTNGVTFKNDTGETTLKARVYNEIIDVTDSMTIKWYKDDIYLTDGKELLVKSSDVLVTSVYRFEALNTNNEIVSIAEVTITDISDGTNGETPTITINDDASVTFKTSEQTETTPVLKGKEGDPGSPGTNGQDAMTVVMTNDNVTLPANAQGGVTSYANSGTTFSVFRGTTRLTPITATTPTDNDTYSVVSSPSGITTGSKTVNTTDKVITYGNHSAMSATSGATATVTYTVTVRVNGVNTTFTKVQNISKSEKGITGDDGVDSYTYIRYSAYSDGTDMTSSPNADSKYIGLYTTTSATAPADKSAYTWSKYAGNDANKYGDNVIRNPKWDNIPYGTLNYNDANLLAAGWNVTKPSQLLAPESDAPSEPILRIPSGNNYAVPFSTPVMPGERYLISYQVRLTDYLSQATSATMVIRGYSANNNSNTTSSANNRYTTIIRPNGVTSGKYIIDKSNVPVISDNNWNNVSFIFEIPDGDSYLRLLPYNSVGTNFIDYRKLEMRKIQQGTVTISSTEPSYKYVGMQWKYTGTSAITIGDVAIQTNTVYIWNGATWDLNLIRSTNLQVDNGYITNAMIANLNASKINAGTLDAARIAADSITADKLNVNNLSVVGYYMNVDDNSGILMDNGTIRSVEVAVLTAGKYRIYIGSELSSGNISFYNKWESIDTTTQTSIENVLQTDFLFNSTQKLGNIGAYGAPNTDPALLYNAGTGTKHQFIGDLTVGGSAAIRLPGLRFVQDTKVASGGTFNTLQPTNNLVITDPKYVSVSGNNITFLKAVLIRMTMGYSLTTKKQRTFLQLRSTSRGELGSSRINDLMMVGVGTESGYDTASGSSVFTINANEVCSVEAYPGTTNMTGVTVLIEYV